LLGVPAISLPLLSDENMPLGLQIVGHAHEDARLLAAAQWLWQSYPGRDARKVAAGESPLGQPS
jgi:Asp-tRNA(Asn)/Glu-tRNA(Gln) amidotransferase A subunit family amidase